MVPDSRDGWPDYEAIQRQVDEMALKREEEGKAKLPWEGRRKARIPMLGEMISGAVNLTLGTKMFDYEIAEYCGINKNQFSTTINDRDGCTRGFIEKICVSLENIPTDLFYQVCNLSPNFEEKGYEKDPGRALADFEKNLQLFLNKTPGAQPYQSVFDTPAHYEPSDSANVGISVLTWNGAWKEKPRLDWSSLKDNAIAGERLAHAKMAKPVRPDFQFYDGEDFLFRISSKAGRKVIILETDMAPHRPYSWALINGSVNGEKTLGNVDLKTGRYEFEGGFSGSSGMCRIAVAVVDGGTDADSWDLLEAGAICPAPMLNALAELVKSDLCWLGTFTYEMTPRIQIS